MQEVLLRKNPNKRLTMLMLKALVLIHLLIVSHTFADFSNVHLCVGIGKKENSSF